MNLLVFSPFYPPHKGGLESHSDEFNKHLAAAGVHITVYTPHLPTNTSSEEICYERVTILRFPAVEIIHNYPLPQFWKKNFWQIWKKIRQEQYDLVLSRTRFFFTSLMAGYFARKNKLPWIHIEHGSDFAVFHTAFKTFLGQLYDLTLGALVLKRSDLNIANSIASANFVKKLSSRRDCCVIYRGVEKSLIESITPHTYFADNFPGKIVIGFIGRLIDGKGVMDLLEAFSRLSTPTSICCIIGDGPERKNIEKFIHDKKLHTQVILLGEKPFSEAIALLKSFDIFVNPSYTEGIPTAVIEAALAEKAIIATNVGGTSEIITGDRDGVLITPGDIETLQNALSLLISNQSLRQSLGQAAFKQVQGKFDWEYAAKQYLCLFQKILNK